MVRLTFWSGESDTEVLNLRWDEPRPTHEDRDGTDPEEAASFLASDLSERITEHSLDRTQPNRDALRSRVRHTNGYRI